MKKSIALLLVLCMVAVLLPAFGGLSFADTAVSLDDLLKDRTPLTVTTGAPGSDHGFLDGNANVSEGNIATLLGVSTQDEVMDKTRVFVDGVEAKFNKGYQGYKHCGLNGGGGYFYGVVGAAYTAGTESTLTILAGDDYYIEQKFTPTVTALAVASSDAKVYKKGCDITVTFANANHGITTDTTVDVCAHDDHNNTKTFAVTSVDGATVTLHSDDYTTSYTLLECTVNGSGVKFSLPVDAYVATLEEATLEEIIGDREKLGDDYTNGSNINSGDGFLDGNLHGSKRIDELIGVSDNAGMMQKTVPYVSNTDGSNVQNVRYNYTYQGYTHTGISYLGGVWFAILGAELVQGQEYTLTILVGDDYYVQRNFTAESTALATESSSVVYYYNQKGCDVTVVMRDANHGIQKNDTFTGCTHDEHDPKYTFTVTEVNGKTVTMHSDTFQTSHTLLELTKEGSGAKIALSINGYEAAKTAAGSIQYAEDNTNTYGAFNARVIVEINAAYLKNYKTAKLKVEFTTANDETKTGEVNITEVFRSIKAGGQTVTTSGTCVMFGVQVKHVPYGTKSVKASVTLTKADGETSDTLALGEATLPDNTHLFIRPGYAWVQGEMNVTSSTGKNSGGESAPYLFDKTPSKYGFHSGGADQVITWNYSTTKKITGYAIFSGNDTDRGGNANRNPKGWKLEGSMDSEGGWTLIDEQHAPDGGTINIGNHGAGTFYPVENTVSYRYYRITFETNSAYFQIGEIQMFETYEGGFVADNYIALTTPNEMSINKEGSGNEWLDKLFDGNKGTKLGIYGDLPSDGVEVKWSYTEAQTVTAYSVTQGGDTGLYERQAGSWTLYACNGDDNWVVLDQYDNAGMYSDSGTDYIILRNTTAYTHYRLVFKPAAGQFQMGEVTLYTDAQ